MNVSIPDKSYFRIGEVSRLLSVQPYVIRYWESEFKTVRPIRTRSDQRLYRHKDVEELLLIRKLLYEENFTINGARKQLRKMRGEEADFRPRTGGKSSSHEIREGFAGDPGTRQLDPRLHESNKKADGNLRVSIGLFVVNRLNRPSSSLPAGGTTEKTSRCAAAISCLPAWTPSAG